MPNEFSYLMSAYSLGDREENFRKALEITIELLKCGQLVFSPIVYGHFIDKEIKKRQGQEPSKQLCLEFDEAILRGKCDEALIATDIEGWQYSEGCQQEITWALEEGLCVKPIGPELVEADVGAEAEASKHEILCGLPSAFTPTEGVVGFCFSMVISYLRSHEHKGLAQQLKEIDEKRKAKDA